MPDYTLRLNLPKPKGTESVTRENHNKLVDAIDAGAAKKEDLDDHVASQSAHGATHSATASKIMSRDESGRAKVAAPDAADDIARKDTVDTAIATHNADYIRQPGYGTTAGTSTAYTLTLSPALSALVEGVCVAFKVHAASGANPTLNINAKGAKAIKKPNGVAATLIKDAIYTARYNGTDFILQGEGGGGTATAASILAGDTATVNSGEVIGTMPNRGVVAIIPSGSNQAIQAGYHNGSGQVAAVSVPPEKVLIDTTIAGQAGTMPDRAGDTAASSSTVSGTTLKLLASDGYRDGVDDYVTITDADFLATNIKKDVNLFGLVGTYAAKRFASGTATTVKSGGIHKIFVTGLPFTPTLMFAQGMTAILMCSIYKQGNSWDSTYRNSFLSSSGGTVFPTSTTSQGTASNEFRITSDGFEMLIFSDSIGVPEGVTIPWIAFE